VAAEQKGGQGWG